MGRDIDLVIRAKTEAAKVLDELNKSAGTFVSGLEQITKSGEKTDTILDALKREFSALGKEVNALTGLNKISDNLDRAGNAVKRLTDTVDRQEAELKALNAQTEQLARTEQTLRGQAESAAAAVARQKEAVGTLKTESREAAAEIGRLERALGSLEKAKAPTTQPRGSLASLSRDRQGPGGNLRNELPGSTAREAAQTLLSGQLSAARATHTELVTRLTRETDALAQEERALKDVNATLKATGQEQRTLGNTIDSVSVSLERENRNLETAKAGLREIEAASTAAASGLSKLSGATGVDASTQERIAAVNARLAAQQAGVKSQIERLSKSDDTVKRSDDPTVLNRQKLEAKRAFVEAQEQVRLLAKSMREAETPTEELGKALGESQVRARQAKQEYLALAEAAAKLKNTQSSFAEFSANQPKTLRQYGAAPTQTGPAADRNQPAMPLGGRSAAQGGVEARAALPPIRDYNAEIKKTGAALQDNAKGEDAVREAVARANEGKRESLSLMQRLRGEVLSLVASYAGLQAAFSGISRAIDTFRAVEAVQNRLGAVFNQNTARVAQEITWLQREAARLGVSFSVLADEYGKVQIAAKAQNISSEDTRKIFISVAEAGRVNKLSQQQLSSVFLALTQMMSKGKVMSQELSLQMGNALPGAFAIFSKALGKTDSEMRAAVESGEILANSENLLKFAEELDRRFGSQLAESLKTTTTEMARFQNSMEQAALAAANGGLIDGFTLLLKTLNEYFNSPEGRIFFAELGAAAGKFFTALASLVPYMSEITTLISVMVGVKAAQFFLAAGQGAFAYVAGLKAAALGTQELTVAQRMAGQTVAVAKTEYLKAQIGLEMLGRTSGAAGGALIALSGSMTIAARTASLLATSARGVLALLGGIPGLILTGVTLALGHWLTSLDDTNTSLIEHRALVDEIVKKYNEAKDKTSDWAKEIKGASRIQLTLKIDEAQKQLDSLKGSIVAPTDYFGGDKTGSVAKIKDAVQAFKEGKTSAVEYKAALDEIAKNDPLVNKSLIGKMQEAADKAAELEKSLKLLSSGLALVDQKATDADKAILSLPEGMKDTGAIKAAADMKLFGDALDSIKAKIPELAALLKKSKDETELWSGAIKAVEAAAGDPKLIGQATDLYEQGMRAISQEYLKTIIKSYGGDKLPVSLISQLIGSEGLRQEAYRDEGGVPTIGVGATRRRDGSAVQMGDVITKDEAIQLLVENLGRFAAMVDAAVKVPITENQRNALISYVYNVGNTDGSERTRAIFKAINERQDAQTVAEAIQNGVNTVKGKPNEGLTNRRAAEAKLYLRPDNRPAGEDSGATEYDQRKARADAQKKLDDDIAEQTRKSALNAADQKKINEATDQSAARREVAIELAVREKINQAEREGLEIKGEALDKLKAATAAEYDQLHINDQAKEAEEKVNALYKLRQQLLEEINVAREKGDLTSLTAAEEALKKVNEQTREAIQLAIQHWQAIGGPEADLAISKLKIMGLTTEKNKTSILTAQRANEMMADGMVRAFSTAAEGIGRAIAGTGKWKDAIRGLGIAFLQFAADFLREIAQMILKALILKALQTALGMPGGGGTGGGMVADFANSLVNSAHTGGIVGAGRNNPRFISNAVFLGAQRLHTGGMPGLKSNEVPTILDRTEEVLTRNDPRHVMNGGKNARGNEPQTIQSVLVMDPQLIPDAMSSPAGTRVLMSTIKANRATLKQLLG